MICPRCGHQMREVIRSLVPVIFRGKICHVCDNCNFIDYDGASEYLDEESRKDVQERTEHWRTQRGG